MRKAIEILRAALLQKENNADCEAALSILSVGEDLPWRGCSGYDRLPKEDGVYLFLVRVGAGWEKRCAFKKDGYWDTAIVPYLFDINSFIVLDKSSAE